VSPVGWLLLPNLVEPTNICRLQIYYNQALRAASRSTGWVVFSAMTLMRAVATLTSHSDQNVLEDREDQESCVPDTGLPPDTLPLTPLPSPY
jgi:hypothetical protein